MDVIPPYCRVLDARFMATAILVLLCGWLPRWSVAQPDMPYPPAAETLESANQLARDLQALVDLIPAEDYRLEDRIDRLDYEYTEAVRFVTEEVAFEPYIGVMKGAEATLNAKAGSAWDQAILLASLLGDMGADAQIVSGELAPADAKRLLRLSLPAETETRRPEPPFEAEAVLDIMDKWLAPEEREDFLSLFNNTGQSDNQLADATEAVHAALLEKLAAADIDLAAGAEAATAALLESLAKHYAWVRYREAPGDPWQAVHPAFAGAPAPEVKPDSFHAGEAPGEVLHQIEIALSIERRMGERTEMVPLMDNYRRPVAPLLAQQMTLALVPPGGPGDTSSAILVPVLNGVLPDNARAFTLEGITAPAADALAGPEIFATASGKLADAASALAGDRASQLTGVIFELSWIAPGGATRTARRRLVDLREGPLPTSIGEVQSQHVIHVSAGATSGSAEAVRTVNSAAIHVGRSPYLAAVVSGDLSTAELAAMPEMQGNVEPWPDMLVFGQGFELSRTAELGYFRTGPQVVMWRRGQAALYPEPMSMVIDILQNPAIALRGASVRVEASPVDTMRLGVHETLFERLFALRAPQVNELMPGEAQLIRSQAELNRLQTAENVPLYARERMRDDLASLGALLVRETPEGWFWWQIDPMSGESLGMTRHGGAAVPEYVKKAVLLISFGVSAYYWKNDVDSCSASYWPDDKDMYWCCVAGATMWHAGSLAGGVAVNKELTSIFLPSVKAAWKATLGFIATAVTVKSASIGLGKGATLTGYKERICRAALE